MSSLHDEYLSTSTESIERASATIACAAFLTAGGASMVVGSVSPWDQWSFITSAETFRLDGLQLGPNGAFSIAGVITILFGVAALLSGSVRLADKRLPRILDLPPVLDGLVGVAVGLYGLGESTWYKQQVSVPPGKYAGATSIFHATAGYGIWLVLAGGLSVLLSAVYSRPIGTTARQQGATAVVILFVAAFTATVLAPEWVGWIP